MIRRPPRSTRTDTLFPYTTLFRSDFSLRFHLAPPVLARRDPRTGIPRKLTLGPGMEKVFRLLAHGKILRGTWLDIFSYSAERKMERRLMDEYRAAIFSMRARLRAEERRVGKEGVSTCRSRW